MKSLIQRRAALRAWMVAVLAVQALALLFHFTFTEHGPSARGAVAHVSRCDHAAAPATPSGHHADDPAELTAGCPEPHGEAEVCALAALQSGLFTRPSLQPLPSVPAKGAGPPASPASASRVSAYRLAPKTSPPQA